MSGVFGFISTRPDTNPTHELGRMADRMSHFGGQCRETWIDAASGVALGRLSIGILNREPQPVVSRDGNVIVFMTGEFFDWDGAPTADHPARERASSDADYALQLYELHGENFVRHLAGAFVLALYDRIRRVVLLATDRFGLYPLYYTQTDGGLVFAPEVKGVLKAAGVSRQLDNVALAQYMRFQQLLGVRTFFQNVQLLPPASVLTFDLASGARRIESYWSFDDVPATSPEITFDEAVEEAARLMRQAVARRLRDDYRFGVYLSGGLDSRTILAAYPREYPRPATLTYGLNDCRDAYYASRVAQRARTSHRFCAWSDGKWVKDYAATHLALTEGFHAWIHMHGISTLDTARSLFDIKLTGLSGDQNLGGYSLDPTLDDAPDDLAYLAHVFWRANQVYNWPGITEAEERTLYTPETLARTANLAFESLRQELQPYLKYEQPRRIDYFGLMNMDLRHFGHYLTFYRSRLDIRHPYFDYDLLDYVWRIKPAFREHRRLQKAVLNRLDPSLALVPIDKDETLPTDRRIVRGAHALAVKARRRFNKHVFPIFRDRFTLHTDYEGWLRTDLREWAQAILFDRRTLDRGIFNPDFIRSIWARHQSGREQWTLGKIAPILTYEMMLRELHDAP